MDNNYTIEQQKELLNEYKNNLLKKNLNNLNEILVFVISSNKDSKKDGIFYSAIIGSQENFRDHADALNKIYNDKIRGFFKTKINSRERNVYEHIIYNQNNILFLNTSKGGNFLRGTLYLPKNISIKQYESLKSFEEGLSYFSLNIIFDNFKEKIEEKSFNLDNYYNYNNLKQKTK